MMLDGDWTYDLCSAPPEILLPHLLQRLPSRHGISTVSCVIVLLYLNFSVVYTYRCRTMPSCHSHKCLTLSHNTCSLLPPANDAGSVFTCVCSLVCLSAWLLRMNCDILLEKRAVTQGTVRQNVMVIRDSVSGSRLGTKILKWIFFYCDAYRQTRIRWSPLRMHELIEYVMILLNSTETVNLLFTG